MKRQAHIILILGIVLAATGLGGCGSGSSTSSAGSTSAAETTAGDEGSLTKAQFIAKADAHCEATKAKQGPLRSNLARAVAQARAEERDAGTISDAGRRELAEALDQIATIGESDLSRLEGLGTPDADSNQLEAFFQEVKVALAASHTYAAALESHEDAKAQAVAEEGGAETREATRMAKQYGFKVCGTVH